MQQKYELLFSVSDSLQKKTGICVIEKPLAFFHIDYIGDVCAENQIILTMKNDLEFNGLLLKVDEEVNFSCDCEDFKVKYMAIMINPKLLICDDKTPFAFHKLIPFILNHPGNLFISF